MRRPPLLLTANAALAGSTPDERKDFQVAKDIAIAVKSDVDLMLARSLATQFGALSVTNALKTDAEIGEGLAKSE